MRRTKLDAKMVEMLAQPKDPANGRKRGDEPLAPVRLREQTSGIEIDK